MGISLLLLPYVLPKLLHIKLHSRVANKKLHLMQSISIYFGSQTGTSEGFAKDLVNDCDKVGIQAKLKDLETFNEEEFRKENIVIIVISTYGKGGPPSNAKAFSQWITKCKINLSQIRFTVFGCGSSGFKTFNAMGKKTFDILKASKAVPLYEPAFGDASQSIEKEFVIWKDGLIKLLKVQCQIEKKVDKPNTLLSLSTIATNVFKAKQNRISTEHQSAEKLLINGIKQVRQCTEETSTYLISIDCSKASFKYKTAQDVAVFCSNSKINVNRALKLLGIVDPNMYLVVNSDTENALPFPIPINISKALKYYCDLTGKLK